MEFEHMETFAGLRNLIHYNLVSLASKRMQGHEQLIRDFDVLIAQAASQARQKLEQIVLFQNNVSSTLVYTRHRGELIILAQELIRYATPAQLITPSGSGPASVVAAGQVYNVIEALFEFVEMRFAPIESVDTYLAERYRRIVQAKIAYGFKPLIADLETDSADPTLLTIIQAPYNQALADNNGNFLTYRRARYLLALKDALHQVQQTRHRDTTGAVMDVLLAFEFNSPAFLDYYVMDIELALNLHEKSADQLYCLQGYHRRIQKVLSTPGMRLMERQDSLLNRLSTMIQDEKVVAGQSGNRAARIRPVPAPLPEERSCFGVPTEVVSYLLDTFDRAKLGVINRSRLSRFIASIFTSHTGKPISDKYFRKISHAVEDRVRKNCIALLKMLIDLMENDTDRDR